MMSAKILYQEIPKLFYLLLQNSNHVNHLAKDMRKTIDYTLFSFVKIEMNLALNLYIWCLDSKVHHPSHKWEANLLQNQQNMETQSCNPSKSLGNHTYSKLINVFHHPIFLFVPKNVQCSHKTLWKYVLRLYYIV